MTELAGEIAARIGNASALFPVADGHAIAEVDGPRILVTVGDRDGSKREFVVTVTELGGAG